jgi:hypothetical protein
LILNPLKVRQTIEAIGQSEMQLSPEIAADAAFHMTDWLEDLAKYVEFCQDPQRLTASEANQLIIQFLAHVPNHLAAKTARSHRIRRRLDLIQSYGLVGELGVELGQPPMRSRVKQRRNGTDVASPHWRGKAGRANAL